MPLSFSQHKPASRPPPITPERRRKLIFSYLPDWLMTILLVFVFFFLDEISGFKRDFSLNDRSLQHPFAVHERVPNWALMVIAIAAPFVLNLVINVLTVRSWWDAHCATLGLLLGLATTGSITQFVKVTVGRPRPDVISRCIPLAGSEDPLWGLSTANICTTDNEKVLKDGFRSFFSGHSSLSFAGLGFLSFYLAGKLHLFDRKGHAGKTWLCLAPFAGASLVAISRSMDYRHHWQDILVGSVVGTVLAYFSYRQYYPHLASPTSHIPYSPRIARETPEEAQGMYLPRTNQDIDHSPTHDPRSMRSDSQWVTREGGEREFDTSEQGYEMAPARGETRVHREYEHGTGSVQERPRVDRVYSQVNSVSDSGYAFDGKSHHGQSHSGLGDAQAPQPRRAHSNFVNPSQGM